MIPNYFHVDSFLLGMESALESHSFLEKAESLDGDPSKDLCEQGALEKPSRTRRVPWILRPYMVHTMVLIVYTLLYILLLRKSVRPELIACEYTRPPHTGELAQSISDDC